MLLKLHAKLAPGQVLIQVNFDPIYTEKWAKSRGWSSLVSERSFTRLWYILSSTIGSSCMQYYTQVDNQLNMLPEMQTLHLNR